ncbi:unnamed protein product [Gongylonema pulchrum]|uniref:oxaloacetate tautomerase n=1 Tax=Gongylonema pulchrum TaxID=637853 RepID=A0A183DZI2_9BILA|nr:unnamed protein product [Gongylonema pulchrum]
MANLFNYRNLGKKIVCVARNYKDHALELGNALPKKPLFFVKSVNSYVSEGRPIVAPAGCNKLHQEVELGVKPLFFVKSVNSYVSEGRPIVAPAGCNKLHQEVELGVVFSKHAKNVQRNQAFNYIGGYTVALDMTARDFQDEAKKAGAPWFLSKSFDTSCPAGDFIEARRIPDPRNVELFCRVNGEERQRCKTNAMIFDIPTLIEHLTTHVTMEPGDVLLTGTPAGVSAVKSGDCIEFGLEGIMSVKFHVQ